MPIEFDPYEELEVSPNASSEVVSAAYRRLARKYHPDNGTSVDAAKMVRLNRAFDALRSPERRAQLDRRNGRGPRAQGREPDVEELQGAMFEAATSGRWRDVLSLVERIVDIAPEDVEALLHGAEAWIELGEGAEAIEFALRAIEIEPLNEDALLFGCEAAALDGDWVMARGLAATVLLPLRTSVSPRTSGRKRHGAC